MEKKTNKKINKTPIIIAVIIVLIIILVIVFVNSSKKEKELKLDEFEKIAVYGYLEDSILDVETMYRLAGKTEYDELQVFQAKLKQALDTYFDKTSEDSVPTSTVLGQIEEKYVPEEVDFNGIVVSDYVYNPENDTFDKAEGTNPGMQDIEMEANTMDYSDKKADVQNIVKEDDKYKVSFNINDNNDIVEATGEAIITINDGKITIESCNIAE